MQVIPFYVIFIICCKNRLFFITNKTFLLKFFLCQERKLSLSFVLQGKEKRIVIVNDMFSSRKHGV